MICLSQIAKLKYQPHEITIKLKSHTSPLNKTSPGINRTQLDIPSLDRKLAQAGASNIQTRFHYHSQAEDYFGISRIFKITFPSDANLDDIINTLLADENIEYAERIPLIQKDAIPNDPRYQEQQHLPQISAEQAWEIHQGELGPPVIVAIIDDAVDWRHPDLIDNVWQNLNEDADGDGHVVEYTNSGWQFDSDDINGLDDDGNGYTDDFIGWDFINTSFGEDNDPSPEMIEMSHGTHVAGLAAGATNNTTGISSISWNVQFMACKHDADEESAYYDSDLYDGVIYAANHGADIINMSWGASAYSQTAEDVIRDAWSKGSILVGSAGNDDWDLPHYPSDFPHVLSVAAVNVNDRKTSYSNFGLGVDVTAPGGEYWADNAILSTVPGGYDRNQGTSMAAPVTAGLLALIKSYHGDWTNEQILTQLIRTSDNIDEDNTDLYHGKLGYGRINAYRALAEPAGSMPQTLKLDIEKLPPDDANGNQALEKGETASLSFHIRNYSPFVDAEDVQFTLTSQDSDIEILKGGTVKTIPADGAVSLTNIFEIKIDENAQSHIANIKLNIESDKIIISGDECEIQLLIGAGGLLVWEPTPNDPNASGAYIQDFLQRQGFETIYINEYPQSLLGFDAVFLCFGAMSETNPEFDQQMASVINAYLLKEGKLYCEGTPSTLLNENQYTTLLTLMGLASVEIGESDVIIKSLEGQGGTLTQGMHFNGSSQADQRVLQLFPRNRAETLFQESTRGIVGVSYEGSFKQKVVSLSYALAGLEDRDLPSTRARLFTEILNFFELLPNPFRVTDFGSDIKSGHSPLAVQFVDLSFSIPNFAVMQWEWDFNGDGEFDATQQTPKWIYNENNSADVFLKAQGSTRLKSDYIQIFDGTSALEFNGATSIVEISNSLPLNFSQTFTVEAWIFPVSFGENPGYGFGRIIDKEAVSIFLHDNAGIYHEQSLVMGIDGPTGSFSALSTPNGSIVLDQWSHVAVTYDANRQEANISINGEPQIISNFYKPLGKIADHQNKTLFIGNRPDLDRTFDGIIDELRLWNTVRSSQEIQNTMATSIDSETGLIAYWKFDEGNGETIHDQIGQHHGISKMATYVPNTSYNLEATDVNLTEKPFGFELKPSFPNPFNASTIIHFTLPVDSKMSLLIYDILGRRVKTLFQGLQTAGAHRIIWQSENDQKHPVASGIYFCQLIVEKSGQKQLTQTQKLILIR